MRELSRERLGVRKGAADLGGMSEFGERVSEAFWGVVREVDDRFCIVCTEWLAFSSTHKVKKANGRTSVPRALEVPPRSPSWPIYAPSLRRSTALEAAHEQWRLPSS